jgi:hypothetical protein
MTDVSKHPQEFDPKKANTELMNEYLQKVGRFVEGEDGQLKANLHLLGIANVSYGAAKTLDVLLHANKMSTDQTMALKKAITDQTQSFMTDEQSAASEMLYSQIIVLNAGFNRYLQLASLLKISEQVSLYLDMALKCQEQCRKTLQTLHDIKNPKPRAVFIKNAIAQQVNQLQVKTEELSKRLEAQPYAAMDTGSQREAETIDTTVVAVEQIDGANQHGGKGNRLTKQL